jgi:hypothetical protein
VESLAKVISKTFFVSTENLRKAQSDRFAPKSNVSSLAVSRQSGRRRPSVQCQAKPDSGSSGKPHFEQTFFVVPYLFRTLTKLLNFPFFFKSNDPAFFELGRS